jgi:sulfur carrier protein
MPRPPVGGTPMRYRCTMQTMAVTLNGTSRQVDACANLAELVRALGLEGKRVAIERNGEIVPRSAYPATPIASGDRLEIVAAVGGG